MHPTRNRSIGYAKLRRSPAATYLARQKNGFFTFFFCVSAATPYFFSHRRPPPRRPPIPAGTVRNMSALPGWSLWDNGIYALTVRRDCSNHDYCMEVPYGDLGVPEDAFPVFVFRAYMQPGLTVGPDPYELLLPRVLKVR